MRKICCQVNYNVLLTVRSISQFHKYHPCCVLPTVISTIEVLTHLTPKQPYEAGAVIITICPI